MYEAAAEIFWDSLTGEICFVEQLAEIEEIYCDSRGNFFLQRGNFFSVESFFFCMCSAKSRSFSSPQLDHIEIKIWKVVGTGLVWPIVGIREEFYYQF